MALTDVMLQLVVMQNSYQLQYLLHKQVFRNTIAYQFNQTCYAEKYKYGTKIGKLYNHPIEKKSLIIHILTYYIVN